MQAKGYHDHPKPESKTPAELRKVTASYKRKLIDKRRTKTAVMRPDAAERSDLFRFPLSCGAGSTPITAGACAGGAPITAGEEVEGARADLLLNAGDCGNVFKCSGCEYLQYLLFSKLLP